jgi:hypothetical protein
MTVGISTSPNWTLCFLSLQSRTDDRHSQTGQTKIPIFGIQTNEETKLNLPRKKNPSPTMAPSYKSSPHHQPTTSPPQEKHPSSTS